MLCAFVRASIGIDDRVQSGVVGLLGKELKAGAASWQTRARDLGIVTLKEREPHRRVPRS